MVKGNKVAVIGGGFGGLTAAIKLAHHGLDVTVFEKNANVGGKASQFFEAGFRFDTGPSLITMPFVLSEVFEGCGKKIENYIELEQLSVNCRYFYSNGTSFTAYSNREKLLDAFESNFNVTAETIENYFDYSRKIYDLTSDLFLFNPFGKINKGLFSKVIKGLLNLNKIDPFRSMHKANESFFSDKRLVQFFDRYATYNGSNPYHAPATLNIIQHVENNLGGFYSKTGIYGLVEAYRKLAEEEGVKFKYNCEITELSNKNKHIDSLLVNNENYLFDYFVSNIDPVISFEKLLGKYNTREGMRQKNSELSSSAIVLYLGIRGKYENLELHNILFSDDYEKEFESIFRRNEVPGDPTVYIYISSKMKTDDAPEECENWFVMINSPNSKQFDINISDVKRVLYDKIKRTLNIDIEDKILVERVLTPADIEEKTGGRFGAIYGISSNDKSAAFLRQRNKSKEFSNLYFCGGSAHPGGGIPLTTLSGKIAGELLLEDYYNAKS